MIMVRNADGSYSKIAAIKTKDGSSIGKIRGKDGSVYFTSAVNTIAVFTAQSMKINNTNTNEEENHEYI